ncbi:Zn-dependent hydrolase [Maribacter sp. 2307ULW6-5]|uniref:Zn-dependent hydrolase n=1 Tax=Maribacter sp. 2307ULW6-5 TaxID=3386275 RepID=UPI0039BD4090
MLRINGDRLWGRLMEMAQIGATIRGGVCRVALTEEDRLGRDLFVKWCRQLDCQITVDKMGSIFARRRGLEPNAPAVLMGSHLDSQPTGGKFDGALGVLAGLEVIHTLHEANVLTQAPLELVSWTNEEGARFSPAMIASGVFSGDFSLDYAYNQKDNKGITLEQALEDIGYKGDAPVGNRDYKAAFELHIEQGPILEAEQISVGIVTGVQGIRWYTLVLKGEETHAGPSPMRFRKDPMQLLSRLLPELYALVEKKGQDAKITIGHIDARPGVRNTVPGEVRITIDIRHPENDRLAELNKETYDLVSSLNGKFGVSASLEEVWHSVPVQFDEKCVGAVRDATKSLDIPAMEIVSGAGHDSVYLSKVAPTAMIFIPCKDGLSHNELEHADKNDIINGTNVLLQSVLRTANEKESTTKQ